MESEPQNEGQEQPVPTSQPEESAPPVPEESPQEEINDAPDADEPGDDVVPEELAQFEQENPEEPDNVDQEG